MTNKYLLFLLSFLLFSTIYSQEELGFDIDHAGFNYDSTSVYLELYYVFDQSSLTINKLDGETAISANVAVLISDENNIKVIDEQYNLKSPVDSNSSEYRGEDLVGVLSFQIPVGSYNLMVKANDNYSDNAKIIERKIDLSAFNAAGMSISDIELCSKIIQEGADVNSIYYKNSLEIIPNPKSLYGASSPVLYYYLELYGNSSGETDNNCSLERIISQNKKNFDVANEEISLTSSAIVKAGFVNLSKYNSGKYTLTINLKDNLENTIATKSKDFFVYNPNNKNIASNNPKMDYIKSEFGILSEEECDYYYEVAKYIAAESEKDLYESLTTINAKRKYLFEFWAKRDVIPETPLNEYKEEYMSRLAYVNSNYGHRLREGYKTDRGRIALIYGIPDRVDTRSNEAEYKPYEVWNYDSIEGGVVFIFGDTMGISELELLHSTKRGEIFDNNWQRRLVIKGGF